MKFATMRAASTVRSRRSRSPGPTRPTRRTAQLIDELDAAFDRADADDDGAGRRARRRGQALLGRPRPQGAPRRRGALGRDARHARGQAAPRAGHVLRQARADPRLPQADDRRGAGRVLGRRADARVHVRPDRRRRRRAASRTRCCACRASASSCSSSRGSSGRARPRSSCSAPRRSPPTKPSATAS